MTRLARIVILTLFGLHFSLSAQDELPEDELLKKAKNGDASAQAKLALEYEYGKKRPKNDKEAIRWLRKAAEQGHAVA